MPSLPGSLKKTRSISFKHVGLVTAILNVSVAAWVNGTARDELFLALLGRTIRFFRLTYDKRSSVISDWRVLVSIAIRTNQPNIRLLCASTAASNCFYSVFAKRRLRLALKLGFRILLMGLTVNTVPYSIMALANK